MSQATAEIVTARTTVDRLRVGRARFLRSRWSFLRYLLEIALIVAWALYVGRVMLDRDPYTLNSGGDNVSAYGRFFWDHLKSCGTCALWSGDVRGGNPAYIDPNADTFHPIVAIPALLFGTLQSFKITILLCLIMGGVACWWLALELGTGAVARIAAGFMGAAGGYLTGRSYQGLVVVMTSLAASAFVLAAVFRLRRLPTRRSTALAGIVIGQLILAGQGYVQIGMAMLAPAFLILLAGDLGRWRLYLSKAVQALALGMLISSVFLFPFLRYYPSFSKELDPSFGGHQAFRFTVLNLVINEYDYFQAGTPFDLQPFPGIYSNYLGWAIVIFAVVGGAVLWQRSKPQFLVLTIVAIGALWIGSGAPFQLLSEPWAPPRLREFGISIRNPAFIAQAAAPAIIGLASVGVDAGLRWRFPSHAGAPDPRSWIGRGASLAVRLATVGLLVIGIRNIEQGAQQWMAVNHVDPAQVAAYMDVAETDELAWVSPPLSDWALQLFSFDRGLKLSDGWRPWGINGLSAIPPTFIAYRFLGEGVPENMEQVGVTPYALVFHSIYPNQYVIPSSGGSCSAHGEGGNIDVECDVPAAGTLTVQESAFDGWTATVDGQPVTPERLGTWLSVPIPPGASTIELRFRPWDFWVGLALSVAGLIAALAMLILPQWVRFHVHFPARQQEQAEM